MERNRTSATSKKLNGLKNIAVQMASENATAKTLSMRERYRVRAADWRAIGERWSPGWKKEGIFRQQFVSPVLKPLLKKDQTFNGTSKALPH